MTRHGQRIGDEGRTGESGLDVVSALGDQGGESIAGQLPYGVVQQAEYDREGVAGDCVTGDAAVCGHVVIVERLTRSPGQAVEMILFVASEQASGFGDQAGRTVEAGGGHHAVVGLCRDRIVRRRRGIQPVSELESGVPESGRGQQAFHPTYVGSHRVELIGQDAEIPVRLPQRPRHPDRGIAPDGRGLRRREAPGSAGQLERIGDDERDESVSSPLLRGQVEEPVAEEPLDVEQIGRRGRVRRDVTGPAEAFVALRAVGRYVEEIAPGRPDRIGMQLVE